jgi:FHA domain-containing protein
MLLPQRAGNIRTDSCGGEMNMTPAWPAMMCVLAALVAVAGQPSIVNATEGVPGVAAPKPALRAEAQADLVRTGDAAGAEGETSDAPALSLTAVHDWMVASYERAPALLLGLAALLAVPPLMMAGVVLNRRGAVAAGGDMTQMQTQMVAKTRLKPERRQGVTEGPRWPTEAWIEIEGTGDNARHGIGRTIVRIGRDGDNDICLNEMTVHRYHAAVHRTEDADFVITDLSSEGGNGVKVNGNAVAEVRLEDGDLIELGLARLKFIAKPA